jgi:electron transfer flavoprotein alpha/beta subunit
MTTQTDKAIERVLSMAADSIGLNECDLAIEAPKLAKALAVAVEALKHDQILLGNKSEDALQRITEILEKE